MGPVGRLWRRAPAWRLLLVTAVSCTALAAMFPPSVPAGLVGSHRLALAGIGPSVAPDEHAGIDARFTPQPVPAPSDYSSVQHPPLGTLRSGSIPFNGRHLQLPPGEWQVAELARTPNAAGALNVQVETFVQIKSHAVVSVLVTFTPDPVIGGLPPPAFMQTCLASKALAGQIAPPDPAKPLDNECWVLTNATLSTAKDGPAEAIRLPELERFRRAGFSIPERGTALDYRQSDQTGWLVVSLFDSEEPVNTALERRRLQAWSKAYAVALHRGFGAVDEPSRSFGKGNLPP